MDYTVHGILQARILKWVAFPFSRGSSQRSGGGHGSPLQYSYLENPHGQRKLAGQVHGVIKSQTQLND